MSHSAPDHWQKCSGPANWFQLSCPPAWTVRSHEGSITIGPTDSSAMLSVHAFWHPDIENLNLRSVIDADTMYPGSFDVHEAQPLDRVEVSVATYGWARHVDPRAGLWKRMFVRAERRRWRLWAMLHDNVCVVASLAHVTGDSFDQEVETITVMILNSLRFAERLADPPEVFADRVLALARSTCPLMECARAEGFQIQVGESSLNLANFYRAYIHHPERFREVMLPAITTMVQLQEWGEQQTTPRLEDVQDRIMPMLYPEQMYQDSVPKLAGTPWVAGLTILYVVDEPNAYWYIRADLLDRWQITQDDLHRRALDNLEHYFTERSMEFTLANDEHGASLLMPADADAYNAVRLLSAEFNAKLRGVLGVEFAAGIPNRDFFVAVSLKSLDTLDRVKQKIAEDYAHMDHPLTARLLVVSPDGVSEFCDEGTAT